MALAFQKSARGYLTGYAKAKLEDYQGAIFDYQKQSN